MRTHLKIAAAVLLLSGSGSLFAGPNAKTPPPAVLGQPFEVELGQARTIAAQKLNVKFERVLEDSRCPKGVECVWAGQIRVAVALKKAAQPLGNAQLTLQGNSFVTPRSVGKIGQYHVKIIRVAPERERNSTQPKPRITLVVSNKPFAEPQK